MSTSTLEVSAAVSKEAGAVADAAPGNELEDRLGWSEKIAYGTGEVGVTIGWNLVTGFIVFYYTDIARLPLAVVGTIMLATRLLDAAFDPLAGALVDRTRTRLGQTRPYFLLVPIPFAVLLALTFSVPDVGATLKIVYAYATLTLLGAAYSLLHIPYSALLPLMTRASRDKVQLASLRSVGTSLGSVLVYASALAIVRYAGAGDQRLGFTVAASIAGGIAVLSFVPVFRFCRERFSTPPVPRTRSDWPSRVRWMRNPVWLLGSIIALMMFVRIGIVVADTAYFAKNVLGDVTRVSAFLPLLSVAILAGGMAAAPLLGKFGLVRTNIAASLLAAALLVALPVARDHMPLFMAMFAVANVSLGLTTASVFVLIADATELQGRFDGNPRAGLLSSSVSFCAKVGIAVGGSLVAFALAVAAYDPGQKGSASGTIAVLFYYAPAALALAQAVMLAAFRPPASTTDKEHAS